MKISELFSRKKEEKIYSLEEALNIIKSCEGRGFTTIPVGGGFKVVAENNIEQECSKVAERKRFSNNLNGYNSYQVPYVQNNYERSSGSMER